MVSHQLFAAQLCLLWAENGTEILLLLSTKKKKGHTIFEVFTSKLLEMKLQPLFTWAKVLVTLLVLGPILLLKRI